MGATSIHGATDLLGILGGELEVFRYPVSDLVERYGRRYEADARFVLRRLEDFAGRLGETLAEALHGYRRHVARAVEDRRASGGSAQAAPGELGDQRVYLYVLTLSTVLNRSRYELFLDFQQTLAAQLKRPSLILEIGAGNCLNAWIASRYGKVEAYELNELSLEWLHLLDLAGKVDLRIAEYGFDDRAAYDFVAMVELLEHVLDPVAYLRGARRVLKNGGLAYLTFAIRMPQADHLTTFTSIPECREILSDCGFQLIRDHCLIDTYRPFEEHERWLLAEDPDYAVIYCCLARSMEPKALDRLVSGFNEDLAS